MRRSLSHVRRKDLDVLDDLLALDHNGLGKHGLGALRGAAAQMALATLGVDNLARAGQANPLGCRLVGLELLLTAGFRFARHRCMLLSVKIANRERSRLLLAFGF